MAAFRAADITRAASNTSKRRAASNISKRRNASNTSKNYKWFALSTTSLGALLSVLNETTLVIALPAIMGELHASFETVVWVLMAYTLLLTILVPSFGRVADMFGRKSLYVAGFAVFTLGSLMAGLSRTGGELIIMRIVQAIGGSLMLANSTAIVTDAFPRNELGQALGINAAVIAVAAILGPVIGGYLTSFGWHWVFWFNVPLGVIGTIWAAIQLRELVSLPEHQRFDWLGTIGFSLGLLDLLVILSFGPLTGWFSPAMLGAMVIAAALLAFFIWWEGRVAQPMLDLSMFRDRLLSAAFTTSLLNGIARGAVTFLLVFYFQGVRGYDAEKAGLLLAPFALAMMVVAPISGALSDRYGSRELSSLGLLVSGIGLVGLALIQPGTSIAALIVWMMVMGAGSGFFNSPNTNAIMGAVPAERRGIAAGTRTMMMNAGVVVSMAFGLAVTVGAMSPTALQGLFAGTQVGSEGIAVDAFTHGLHVAFTISVIISVIAAGLSLLRPKKAPALAAAAAVAPQAPADE